MQQEGQDCSSVERRRWKRGRRGERGCGARRREKIWRVQDSCLGFFPTVLKSMCWRGATQLFLLSLKRYLLRLRGTGRRHWRFLLRDHEQSGETVLRNTNIIIIRSFLMAIPKMACGLLSNIISHILSSRDLNFILKLSSSNFSSVHPGSIIFLQPA